MCQLPLRHCISQWVVSWEWLCIAAGAGRVIPSWRSLHGLRMTSWCCCCFTSCWASISLLLHVTGKRPVVLHYWTAAVFLSWWFTYIPASQETGCCGDNTFIAMCFIHNWYTSCFAKRVVFLCNITTPTSPFTMCLWKRERCVPKSSCMNSLTIVRGTNVILIISVNTCKQSENWTFKMHVLCNSVFGLILHAPARSEDFTRCLCFLRERNRRAAIQLQARAVNSLMTYQVILPGDFRICNL